MLGRGGGLEPRALGVGAAAKNESKTMVLSESRMVRDMLTSLIYFMGDENGACDSRNCIPITRHLSIERVKPPTPQKGCRSVRVAQIVAWREAKLPHPCVLWYHASTD